MPGQNSDSGTLTPILSRKSWLGKSPGCRLTDYEDFPSWLSAKWWGSRDTVAQVLSSHSVTFYWTCPQRPGPHPGCSGLPSGKMNLKAVIAISGSPDSFMQAYRQWVPSPHCPCFFHFSCLNICPGSSPLTLSTYRSSPLTILHASSIAPRIQAFTWVISTY